MLNTTLKPIVRYTSTRYDFDLDPRFILHVTNAENLAEAKARVAFFLSRLREEEAKGKAANFFYVHDAEHVPLMFYLRNRAFENVSCWLSFKTQEDRERAATALKLERASSALEPEPPIATVLPPLRDDNARSGVAPVFLVDRSHQPRL
jgi:hypothetical protein